MGGSSAGVRGGVGGPGPRSVSGVGDVSVGQAPGLVSIGGEIWSVAGVGEWKGRSGFYFLFLFINIY